MPELDSRFSAILQNARAYLPGGDFTILEKAYQFSRLAHEKQRRAGGDPYLTHPLEVTFTLSELHLDLPTLVAGLLHDVLEDTAVTSAELIAEFGPEVTQLVEGVTKIDSLEGQAASAPSGTKPRQSELTLQAENWRKMIIATAHDIRVILLKLADRKHNMETLEFLEPERKKRIAEETLSLYAPMAQRLGMYQMKSTLEDLSIKYLEPDNYQSLKTKLNERESLRMNSLEKCISEIGAILTRFDFPYRISARPKNLYSVYRKMRRQNKPFEEIQDLVGVRVITDTVEHCYALLGIMQTHFQPEPGTFTDYIALPKNNLYQSLHLTVKIPRGELVEIQIRTEQMHHIAEYGIAAHWRYKQTSGAHKQDSITDSVENKLDWLKQILEWQQETDNPHDFLDGLKVELDFDQVFVFTPKGEVKKLPSGSTPIDFAFAVHTELGSQCVGAKVNNKMVRLDYKLKSGDRCEILVRKGQHPHKDWLEWVRTPRARSKIRKFFRESDKGPRH